MAFPLAIGALSQALIATAWVLWRAGRPLSTATFAVAMVVVAVVAQRGLDGIARLIWSVVGCFWAGLAFWLASVPMTLEAKPTARALVYPLLNMEPGHDAAFDLLPIVSTAVAVGALLGALGWTWSVVRVRDSVPTDEGLGAGASGAEITPTAIGSGIETNGELAPAEIGEAVETAELEELWGPREN